MTSIRISILAVVLACAAFAGSNVGAQGLAGLREPPRLASEPLSAPAAAKSDTLQQSVTKRDNHTNSRRGCPIIPPFLHEGDSVAIVSPGFYTPLNEISEIKAVLSSWGLVPFVAPNVGEHQAGRVAGPATHRFDDMQWALINKSFKAVFCSRGGYGTLHLLPYLDTSYFARYPKWIVGYSDITTLHAVSVLGGTMSVHGAVGRELGSRKVNKMNYLLLHDLLFGTLPRYQVNTPNGNNLQGRASGRLVGGNLATLTTLLSTDFDVTRLDSIILFLEDVDEPFHNIDRMFNMLRIHGVFDRCVGLVLGGFCKCKKDLGCETVYELLYPYFKDLGIPVLCDFPTGHGSYNFPLLEGAPATLVVGDASSSLFFNIDGRWMPVGYP